MTDTNIAIPPYTKDFHTLSMALNSFAALTLPVNRVDAFSRHAFSYLPACSHVSQIPYLHCTIVRAGYEVVFGGRVGI